jgi:hypothetical protein
MVPVPDDSANQLFLDRKLCCRCQGRRCFCERLASIAVPNRARNMLIQTMRATNYQWRPNDQSASFMSISSNIRRPQLRAIRGSRCRHLLPNRLFDQLVEQFPASFQGAGIPGRIVMGILALASVWNWALICEGTFSVIRLKRAVSRAARCRLPSLLVPIVKAGLAGSAVAISRESVTETRLRVTEAMNRSAQDLLARADRGPPTLAVVASVSFGTVYGIMTSFGTLRRQKIPASRQLRRASSRHWPQPPAASRLRSQRLLNGGHWNVRNFEDMRRLAQHWIDAWNAHDLARIMEHYAGDIEFEVNTAVAHWSKADGTLRGIVELREHFRRGLQLARNLLFDLAEVFFVPSGYAVLYRWENNNRVADAVEVDLHGKARRLKAFYSGAQR